MVVSQLFRCDVKSNRPGSVPMRVRITRAISVASRGKTTSVASGGLVRSVLDAAYNVLSVVI